MKGVVQAIGFRQIMAYCAEANMEQALRLATQFNRDFGGCKWEIANGKITYTKRKN